MLCGPSSMAGLTAQFVIENGRTVNHAVSEERKGPPIFEQTVHAPRDCGGK